MLAEEGAHDHSRGSRGSYFAPIRLPRWVISRQRERSKISAPFVTVDVPDLGERFSRREGEGDQSARGRAGDEVHGVEPVRRSGLEAEPFQKQDRDDPADSASVDREDPVLRHAAPVPVGSPIVRSLHDRCVVPRGGIDPARARPGGLRAGRGETPRGDRRAGARDPRARTIRDRGLGAGPARSLRPGASRRRVQSSWMFVLRRGVTTGAERHPNSRQRMVSWEGSGDFQVHDGPGWRSHLLV